MHNFLICLIDPDYVAFCLRGYFFRSQGGWPELKTTKQ